MAIVVKYEIILEMVLDIYIDIYKVRQYPIYAEVEYHLDV